MTIERTYRVVIVLEGSKQAPIEAEISDRLETFYDIIKPVCRCVDMPKRYIGTTEYRVIVDDCGAI